ncbi:MAG TPA: GFA family protein [Dongiaceae bacterium]
MTNPTEDDTERCHTGHCLCGQIHYRAKGDPIWTAYCHCESCRRATGVPVTAFACFPVENFTFEGGPARYESSPGVIRTFCPRCGTPLTYEAADLPGEIHLLLGSADRPDAMVLAPKKHFFHEERVSWVDIGPDLPLHKPAD